MDEPAVAHQENPPIPAHAGLRYGLLRLGLLVVVGGLLYLIGLRSWALLFTAVLVSAGLSFFVLLRQREAAARSLEASVSARSERRRAAAPAPDADTQAAPAPADPDA